MRIYINGLDQYPETGVVKKIRWSANKMHEGHGYSMDMVTSLKNKEPTEPGFVPYTELTTNHVLQWLHESGDITKARTLMSQKIAKEVAKTDIPDGWDIQSIDLGD